jgi:hypothetical protein
MDWGKKIRVIWICYIVASLVTFAGAVIRPLLSVGLIMLIAIMLYCLIDSK